MFEKKIILDTNFLMVPGTLGIDIYTEISRITDFKYKLYLLEGSVKELWVLAKGSSKTAQQARLAIILADSKKVIKIKSKNYVDDELVLHAQKGAVICTNDKELKQRIRKVSGKIITVRGKSHLVIES